jgi:DNA-binding transcriptional ArsR family regulator
MQREILAREAAIFNALAHPLRLRILEKLRDGPCCVCKIIPYVGGEQSNVSHHLAILRKANIVHSEKRGVEVWYAATDPRVFGIIDLMKSCLLSNLEKSEVLLETIRQSLDER